MNDFGGEKDVKYCSNYKESGVYCYSGAVGRVGPALNSGGKFDVDNEWPKFKESRQKGAHWDAYLKGVDLPKRFHYEADSSIEPILLAVDDEYYCSKSSGDPYTLVGNHGYDNNFISMRALFMAHGPAFKEEYRSPYVHQNIELYNVMCKILNVEPA